MILWSTRTRSILIATVIGLFFASNLPGQELVQPGSLPEKLICYGSVTDEAGIAIPAADVFLIAPYGESWNNYSVVTASPKVLSASADAEGKFRFEIGLDDPSLKTIGIFTLLVRSPDRAFHSTVMEPKRMMIDLPFVIKLQSSPPSQFILTDANGNPVSGAKVSPAKIGNARIPYEISKGFEVTSNSDGIAEFDHGGKNLRHFYVASEATGHQQVFAAELTPNHWTAQTKPVGVVFGKFILPAGVDMHLLTGHESTILSVEQNTVMWSDRFAWQTVSLDESGCFRAEQLAFGMLQRQFNIRDFPFPISTGYSYPDFKPSDSPLQFDAHFEEGVQVELQVSDESGKRLEGISILSSFTDKNGIVARDFPADAGNGSTFPRDPLLQYVFASPIGVRFKKFKKDQTNSIEVVMQKADSISGRVLDESGTPIPGATIKYTYSVLQFSFTRQTLSDRMGNFCLRGLIPDTSIEISAVKDDLATRLADVVRLNSSQSPSQIELVVCKQQAVQIAGRLVDQNGLPVADVSVKIRKSVAFEKEGYGTERTNSVGLAGIPDPVTSNSQGYFQFPPTVDYESKVQIQVANGNYFPFRSSYMDGMKLQVIDEKLELPTFKLFRRPSKSRSEISIVDDATGKPISNAELVFLGFHAGKTEANSNENGRSTPVLSSTPQLVAVRADGYEILFQWLSSPHDPVDLRLVPASSDSHQAPLPWYAQEHDRYMAVAKELLQDLQQSPPNESTYYRQSLYFGALAVVNPDRYMDVLVRDDSAYENHSNFFQTHYSNLFQRSPDRVVESLINTELSPYGKAALLNELAFRTDNEELKTDLYGEAIAITREFGGDFQLYLVGQVTRNLVIDGRTETAKQLLRDAWDSANELRALVESKTDEPQIGVARRFAPALAIIEPELSLELIRLIASQQEIETGIGEALCYVSICDPERFKELVESGKYHNKSGELIFNTSAILGKLNAKKRLNPEMQRWIGRTIPYLPESTGKVMLWLAAVKHATTPEDRKRYLGEAMSGIRQLPPPAPFSYFLDPTKSICDWAAGLDQLTANELSPIIFEMILKRPDQFDDPERADFFGFICRLMALRDETLARQLLTPAFDDTSWLFPYRWGGEFRANVLLRSAVWINPEWSAEVTRHLSTQLEIDSPLRRLELVSAWIEEANSILALRASSTKPEDE